MGDEGPGPGGPRCAERAPAGSATRHARAIILSCSLGLWALLACAATSAAQPADRIRPRTAESFNRPIAEAQRREDEAAVKKLAAEAREALGDSAGTPESPDRFRAVPEGARVLTAVDVPQAFRPYFDEVLRRKWWRIGDDPTRSERPLRDVASVIVGCLAASRAGCQDPQNLLKLARDAGDYLAWAQERGGRGLFPFPARRGGRGREFEVADRVLRRAEEAGMLGTITRNGWIVEDEGFDPGGLQYDNGLCGVALFELHEATGDERYQQAARVASDWAVGRATVPNWNYNSFSVYLLATAYRATGEEKYRRAAKQKARLGIFPGQIADGPRAGRWYDPHNARIAYHYIIVRSLVRLASVLDARDPDRAGALSALRKALTARNVDFQRSGIGDVDSAFEALLLLEEDLPESADLLGDCGQVAALESLGRYASAAFRSRRLPTRPGVWGRYLEHVVRSSHPRAR